MRLLFSLSLPLAPSLPLSTFSPGGYRPAPDSISDAKTRMNVRVRNVCLCVSENVNADVDDICRERDREREGMARRDGMMMVMVIVMGWKGGRKGGRKEGRKEGRTAALHCAASRMNEDD